MKKENNVCYMIFNPDQTTLEEFFKNGDNVQEPSMTIDESDDIPDIRACDMCDSEFEVPIGPTGFPNALNIYTDAKEAVSTGFTMDLCPKCIRRIFATIGLRGDV